MASRRSRNRRDKRAETDELLGLDTEPDPTEDDTITTTSGERIDLRAPWAFPTTTDERTGQ